MASTGFSGISQAAEILGRQLIDEKSRHFILELLTRTLGENMHLQDSLIKKECEIEDLQAKIQDQDDNAERALGETAEVIEKLEEEINMINESRQKVAKQLTEKDKEIGQKTIQLRQHSWRSNKMIYELKDQLDEKEKELEEFKRLSQKKKYFENDEEENVEYKLPYSGAGKEKFNMLK